jgi:glycosyltransferase involved in cell wall biosynthesis
MIHSNQPLVTVITPVYNGEKYLAECIESVLAQTYKNWEYIIVNNCSTDGTLKIAKEYAAQNDRIWIHENEHFLTVIQNHNHAFRLIPRESKYCKVIHADDWLFPDCIEKMVEIAEYNPTVGIVGSYRLEETRVSCDGLPYPSTVVSGRELCRSGLLGGPYVFGSPTTLLIRSDLIRARQSFYNEMNLHADNEACYELLNESEFGFVHQVLSFTRRNNETMTTFAKRMNTYILADLLILKKFGPIYLSPAEYEKILEKRLDQYYRFLGKSIFMRKGREFWDFHKTGLNELGVRINAVRLAAASAIVLFRHALDVFKNKL